MTNTSKSTDAKVTATDALVKAMLSFKKGTDFFYKYEATPDATEVVADMSGVGVFNNSADLTPNEEEIRETVAREIFGSDSGDNDVAVVYAIVPVAVLKRPTEPDVKLL